MSFNKLRPFPSESLPSHQSQSFSCHIRNCTVCAVQGAPTLTAVSSIDICCQLPSQYQLNVPMLRNVYLKWRQHEPANLKIRLKAALGQIAFSAAQSNLLYYVQNCRTFYFVLVVNYWCYFVTAYVQFNDRILSGVQFCVEGTVSYEALTDPFNNRNFLV